MDLQYAFWLLRIIKIVVKSDTQNISSVWLLWDSISRYHDNILILPNPNTHQACSQKFLLGGPFKEMCTSRYCNQGAAKELIWCVHSPHP